MLRRRNKEVEFNRTHMVAVRLVDALNHVAMTETLVPGFTPILGGFKLTVAAATFKIVEADQPYTCWNGGEHPKLTIRPAGWPAGSVITVFLYPKDGHYGITGDMTTPHLGNWSLNGFDVGGGPDYTPGTKMVYLNIREKEGKEKKLHSR
jgi:hypothetical protein